MKKDKQDLFQFNFSCNVLCIILCILCTTLVTQAQPSLNWAGQMGEPGGGEANSVAIDKNGNVYTAGYFTGTANFNPSGTYNLTSGSTSIFVSKLDSSGNFLWAKQMGGTGSAGADESGYLALDDSGNAFITGTFSGEVNFGTFDLTSIGTTDMFVSKLDPSGNFLWAKQIGGAGASWELGYSFAVDAGGNVLTSGWFSGTANFNPGGNFNLTSSGGTFISKLNAEGNFVWAKEIVGTEPDIYEKALDVDKNGNVYTTGYFTGTANFNPGSGTFNMTGGTFGTHEVFISELDSSGNFVLAKEFEGANSSMGNDIVVDNSGNMYIIGSFSGTYNFNPTGASYTLTSAGNVDIFISKVNASGNLIWAEQMGGVNNSSVYGPPPDNAYSIALDNNDNIYTTGFFVNTMNFNPSASGPSDSLTAYGNQDIYISVLDSSGAFICAGHMGGGSKNSDYGESIALNNSGNDIYLTGYFSGTANFNTGGGTFNLTDSSASNTDIFVVSLRACNIQCTTPVAVINPSGSVSFCTGDSVILNANRGAYIYKWSNGATTQSIVIHDQGNYNVIENNACGTDTSGMINVITLPGANAGIISAVKDTICAGTVAHLTDTGSSGNALQWQSNSSGAFSEIAGATGADYASAPLPQTTYYRVVVNNGTCTAESDSFGIHVIAAPLSVFTSSVNGYEVTFNSDSSTGASSYTWDFGDGSTSTQPNPIHSYDSAGTYHVCLTVDNNSNCTFTLCHNISIFPTGVNGITPSKEWEVYPDPFHNQIFIGANGQGMKIESIELYDVLGRTAFIRSANTITGNPAVLDVSELTEGMYYLQIKSAGRIFITPLIKE